MHALGKEVIEGFLKKHERTITAVFAHNDDMTLGAIVAMTTGKLNATIECNPLQGPQFFDLALKVANGESVPKRVFPLEGIFFQDISAAILLTRKY